MGGGNAARRRRRRMRRYKKQYNSWKRWRERGDRRFKSFDNFVQYKEFERAKCGLLFGVIIIPIIIGIFLVVFGGCFIFTVFSTPEPSGMYICGFFGIVPLMFCICGALGLGMLLLSMYLHYKNYQAIARNPRIRFCC